MKVFTAVSDTLAGTRLQIFCLTNVIQQVKFIEPTCTHYLPLANGHNITATANRIKLSYGTVMVCLNIIKFSNTLSYLFQRWECYPSNHAQYTVLCNWFS